MDTSLAEVFWDGDGGGEGGRGREAGWRGGVRGIVGAWAGACRGQVTVSTCECVGHYMAVLKTDTCSSSTLQGPHM